MDLSRCHFKLALSGDHQPSTSKVAHESSKRRHLIVRIGEGVSRRGSEWGSRCFRANLWPRDWIYQRTGQATPFALTVLFGSLPRLLLLPMAGSLADRWNRRWLMILADTGSALVTVSVVFVLLTGDLQIWHIYLIACDL